MIENSADALPYIPVRDISANMQATAKQIRYNGKPVKQDEIGSQERLDENLIYRPEKYDRQKYRKMRKTIYVWNYWIYRKEAGE